MGEYLLVAHQTGESPEVLSTARELAAADPQAAFTVLVPATPVGLLYMLSWETRPRRQVARWRAQRIAGRLRGAGLRVASARLGNADPTIAVEDALRYQRFAAVIVSTLPAGLSHWLRMDLVASIRRHHPGLRVVHVVAHSFRESAAEGGQEALSAPTV